MRILRNNPCTGYGVGVLLTSTLSGYWRSRVLAINLGLWRIVFVFDHIDPVIERQIMGWTAEDQRKFMDHKNAGVWR